MTSLTDLIFQYDVLKILVSNLYTSDVCHLADTCQAAREYVRGNGKRLDNILTVSIGCKGKGRISWINRQAEVENKLDAQRRRDGVCTPYTPARAADKRKGILRQRIALYICHDETITKQCAACSEPVCNVRYSPIERRDGL